jgi:endoglucanase
MSNNKYHDWSVLEDPRFNSLYLNTDSGLEDMYSLLENLMAIPSSPGFEHGIALELVEILKPLCDEVQVDHVGNVYGKKTGHKDGPVIMCPAHSDAVGFMTESIEPSGYVRFTPMGFIPSFIAYGERVIIITHNGPITGVIGTMPGHSLNFYGDANGRENPVGLIPAPVYDNMFIDIGAGSLEEALKMGVLPGQQIVYERNLRWLGDGSSGIVTGAGLDDKAGLVVLIEVLKSLKGKDIYPTVYVVGATTEELGCRGAGIAGNYLNADMCIGVDGSVSEAGPETGSGIGIGTPPNVTNSELPATIGGGVGIAINDIIMKSFAGLLGNQRINAKMVRLARELDIPYQIEAQAQYVTSDATAIQGTGFGGTPSVTLKLPMRYTHGPVETVSLYDMKACVDLLAAFIEDCTPESFDLKFVDIPEADGGCTKNRTGIK